MELNDTSDYQFCFGCGQENPFGLKMVFRIEGTSVVSDVQPRKEHQGFPGILHGGIIATLLDEVLNRTSILAEQAIWTMTGRLDIRYRQIVPYGPLLRVRGELVSQRRRLIQAKGYLTLAEDEKNILAEAQGTFMAWTQEMLEEEARTNPAIRAFIPELSGRSTQNLDK